MFTFNVVKKYFQNSLLFFACKHLSSCMLYKTIISHSLATHTLYYHIAKELRMFMVSSNIVDYENLTVVGGGLLLP
jgi:hypothetical protein